MRTLNEIVNSERVSMTISREEYISKHFPETAPGARPCGAQILVQLRTLKEKTSGGIILAHETKDFNNGNTQIAKVVATGHIAFRNRETGEVWKEGVWANVGDLIVVPKWGGFRYEVPLENGDKAIFCVFNDTDVKLVVESGFENFDVIL